MHDQIEAHAYSEKFLHLKPIESGANPRQRKFTDDGSTELGGGCVALFPLLDHTN